MGLLLTACAHGPQSATSANGYPDYLSMVLETAQASGVASPEQIDVLERAAETGSLSWDDYKTAILATLDCFDQAGIPYMGPAQSQEEGVDVLGYAAQTGDASQQGSAQADVGGTPESEVLVTGSPDNPNSATPGGAALVAENCRNRNSAFIEGAWEAQPSSLETQDARRARASPSTSLSRSGRCSRN